MLALNTMSGDFTALFYIVAVVAAVFAAFFSWPWRQWHFWVALSLAAFFFVQAWNAVAAA